MDDYNKQVRLNTYRIILSEEPYFPGKPLLTENIKLSIFCKELKTFCFDIIEEYIDNNKPEDLLLNNCKKVIQYINDCTFENLEKQNLGYYKTKVNKSYLNSRQNNLNI